MGVKIMKSLVKAVSTMLVLILALGIISLGGSAATVAYADLLLGEQVYSAAQEAAVRGGINATPENVVSYLFENGLSVETEEECQGMGIDSGACAVTAGTKVYVYDNAKEKNNKKRFCSSG